MDLSIFVARVATLLYLSAGVAMLGGQLSGKKMLESFEDSPGLMMVSGLMSIVLGMLLIEYHNLWVQDWRVLVTIIGWAALIKGVLFIAFPHYLAFFKPWYKNLKPWGLFCIGLGVLFGYFGFVA